MSRRLGTCDFCPWPARYVIMLHQGRFREWAGLPVRWRRVCANHFRRGVGNTAPGWFRH